MAVPTEKIALFIDGSNLYATAKALGFDIDYKRLLRFFPPALAAFRCAPSITPPSWTMPNIRRSAR